MLFVLVIGGGLLGVSLGIVARAKYASRSWSDSRKLGLLIAVLPTAGIIGLFLPLPRYATRIPLSVYLVSLLTGYIVTAMLAADPDVGGQESGPSPDPPPSNPAQVLLELTPRTEARAVGLAELSR